MCKTQLFNTVLQLVAKETEIPECLITSHSRATEVADAKVFLSRYYLRMECTPYKYHNICISLHPVYVIF